MGDGHEAVTRYAVIVAIEGGIAVSSEGMHRGFEAVEWRLRGGTDGWLRPLTFPTCQSLP